MAALDVGTVCIKIAGREAGKYCVVLKKMDNTFVMVTGPKELTGIKRRRCNVEHLEPTSYSLKIAVEATDADVIKAYDTIGLTKRLSLRLPSPEVMKEAEKKVKEIPKKVEKAEKPKKEEKKPEEKKEEKVEKKEEKPKEKKGLTLKFKLPTIRKKEPKEEKKTEKKAEEKVEKKPEKATKKVKKKK